MNGKLTEYEDECHGFVQLKEAKKEASLISTFSEDLCALSNYVTSEFLHSGKYKIGFLVLGLCDNGEHAGPDWSFDKAQSREPSIAREVDRHMFPSTFVRIKPYSLGRRVPNTQHDAGVVVFQVYPASYVTFWDGKAYTQAATSSYEMKEDEVRKLLSLLSPLNDITAYPWSGLVDKALVYEFAKNLKLRSWDESTSDSILTHLNIQGTVAAQILFGDVSAKVSYYDDNNLPLYSDTFVGMFSPHSDTFVHLLNVVVV